MDMNRIWILLFNLSRFLKLPCNASFRIAGTEIPVKYDANVEGKRKNQYPMAK